MYIPTFLESLQNSKGEINATESASIPSNIPPAASSVLGQRNTSIDLSLMLRSQETLGSIGGDLVDLFRSTSGILGRTTSTASATTSCNLETEPTDTTSVMKPPSVPLPAPLFKSHDTIGSAFATEFMDVMRSSSLALMMEEQQQQQEQQLGQENVNSATPLLPLSISCPAPLSLSRSNSREVPSEEASDNGNRNGNKWAIASDDSLYLSLPGFDKPQQPRKSSKKTKRTSTTKVVTVHKRKTSSSSNSASSPSPRVRKTYEPERRIYVQYTDSDVLCQRGGLANKHPGNHRYLTAKDAMQPVYLATPKAGRTAVAQRLVDQVRQWGGRFLKYDTVHQAWYEIHNHTARTKCGQALREEYTPDQRAEKRARYKNSQATIAAQDEQEQCSTMSVVGDSGAFRHQYNQNNDAVAV